MDQKTCEQKYKYPDFITNEVICAKGEGNKCTRLMDTGGPLQFLVHGKWFLVGIASGTQEYFREAGHPDMYARVKPYVEWIRNRIKDN